MAASGIIPILVRRAKGGSGLPGPSINSWIPSRLNPEDQVEPLTWKERVHRAQQPSASWSGSDSRSAKGPAWRFGAGARGGGGPKANGMCGGGGGLSSCRKSARSQRTVSGRRAQGGTRSMCASTRRWKAKAASLRRRGPTCPRRREAFGCCQAHSNCGRGVGTSGRPQKGGRQGKARSPSPSSHRPRLLSYPKGGHGGREAVHDKHHLPGEENKDAACEPPPLPLASPRIKPNPLAVVHPQSYPRVKSSCPASSLVREAPPPS